MPTQNPNYNPVIKSPSSSSVLSSVQNPYEGLNYQVSPWQSLMSSFGIRTQADAWQENMAMNAAEWNSALQLKLRDEEYNSPINQVARMRAAGLNPDIDGGSSISSGEAAAMPEDPSTPMQTTSDADSLNGVLNGCMSAFSTALGLVGSAQGFVGKHLQNVLASITNEKEFADYAMGISGSLLPPSPTPEDMLNYDWKSVALNNAEKFANLQLPKKMRKKFIDFQEQYWSSARGQFKSYDEFANYVRGRKGYAEERSVMYTDLADSMLLDIFEPFAKRAEQLIEQRQKTELAEGKAAEAGAQTEEAYQKELNGTLMGEAQNAQNANVKESKSSESIINEAIHDVLERLKTSSKEGGLKGALASIAMALISGMYLYSASGMHPSVSHSSGSGSFFGPKSSGSHSNSSFSIGF